jgi:hypothetical protein
MTILPPIASPRPFHNFVREVQITSAIPDDIKSILEKFEIVFEKKKKVGTKEKKNR